MNKSLLGLVLVGLLGTAAQADIVRVEAGLGMWNQSIDGDIQNGASLAFTTDDLNYDTETKPYAWMYVKHFIPIVPNLRLEYAAVAFEGTSTTSFDFQGTTYSAAADTTLTMDQLDAILYYNILDNTAWITVDLGLDIKSMNGSFEAADGTNNVDESQTLVLPLGYARGRVEVPGTDLGFEAEVKYLGYKDSKISDMSIKVDYTLVDMIPFVDLGIEAGYRTQTINLDASDISSLDTSLNVDTDGVFVGIVGRF